MNILVSGVAGDIGFGLGRILREWSLFDKLYGIDISKEHAGSLIFDFTDIAPRADRDGYIVLLIKYLKIINVLVYVPTCEDLIVQLCCKIS